jgi:hypothetical protein
MKETMSIKILENFINLHGDKQVQKLLCLSILHKSDRRIQRTDKELFESQHPYLVVN